jgi:hypothetical protein
MPFPDEHVAQMVEHYAYMALQKGWIDYARHRVSALQKEDKMYADLGIRVKKRIEELKKNDVPS